MPDTQELKPEAPNELVTDIKARSGFVAFFDILGYQNFLNAHNNPSEATTQVLSTLLSLRETLPGGFIDRARQSPKAEKYIPHIQTLEYLVFSDTIVIVAQATDLPTPEEKAVRFAVFFYQCSMLIRQMFDFGLPLRGTIESGEFYVAQTCFAGEPFVRAYRRVKELECAVCVVPDETEEYHREVTGISIQSDLPSYDVPVKEAGYKSYCVLPPMYLALGEKGWRDCDLRQVVVDSFWAHGKQMTGTAVTKADNTERLLRYLRMKEPRGFN